MSSRELKQRFEACLGELIQGYGLKQTAISQLTGISVEIIRNARSNKPRGYTISEADLQALEGLLEQYKSPSKEPPLSQLNAENQALMDIIKRQIEEGQLKDELIRRLWAEIDALKKAQEEEDSE